MKTTRTDIDYTPVQRLLQKHLNHAEPYDITFGDVALTIYPGVFSPNYTNTSKFFAENIIIHPCDDVLDMFSGSGALGLTAFKKGANSVTCVEISDLAVKCIEHNIKKNHADDKVQVIQSDLFASIQNKTFDVIIANPPLLDGKPETDLERAVFDEDYKNIERFFSAVSKYLNPNGRIYLLWTSAGEKDLIQTLASKNKLAVEVVNVLDVGYERYTVYQIS